MHTHQLDKLPHPGGDSMDTLFEQLQISEQSTNKKGRVKKSSFQTWDRPEIMVDGWKFNEWDYGKSNIRLPIEARGLFTHKGRIVIRGYDKFFNVNEVNDTKWENIEKNTSGPYYLTLKENGCIVFMSGLEDGTLLVTSKHSTGPRQQGSNEENHSFVATKWIERHLERKGVDKNKLAQELYNLDVTAVAELCDDDFEEHVLAYTGEKAGIYLHGINLNTPRFATYPCGDVAKFAEKYGFFKTDFLIKDTMAELKQFLDECAETGSYNGQDIEGFVVRCKTAVSGAEEGEPSKRDFFFKYKFTEPYLMYRDWREVTKAYINGKSREDVKIRRHVAATNRYLDFVIPLLDNDKALRERYLQNHGIIQLRQQFLDYIGKKGIDLASDYEATSGQQNVEVKYVLVPISVLGCGKTTIGAALAHLLGWGHVQNDELDVPQKQKKHALVKRAIECLKSAPAVFFDRNNHQWRERQQVISDMQRWHPNLKFIGLNFWPDDVSRSELWNLTRPRISNRGDNHSTIQSSLISDQEIDEIVGGFMKRFQPVVTLKQPDEAFDHIIDMHVLEGSRHNLELVIDDLHKKYPELVPKTFTTEEYDQAIETALAYRAKQLTGSSAPKPVKSKEKGTKVTYFSLQVNYAIADLVDQFFLANPHLDATFWAKLKSDDCVNKSFHVTLAHARGKSAGEKNTYKQLISKYIGENQDKLEQGKNNYLGHMLSGDVKIVSIGFNERVMALNVEIVDDNIPCGNAQPHITVGVVTGAKPVESNAMLADPKSTIYDWNIEPELLEQQPLCAYM